MPFSWNYFKLNDKSNYLWLEKIFEMKKKDPTNKK